MNVTFNLFEDEIFAKFWIVFNSKLDFQKVPTLFQILPHSFCTRKLFFSHEHLFLSQFHWHAHSNIITSIPLTVNFTSWSSRNCFVVCAFVIFGGVYSEIKKKRSTWTMRNAVGVAFCVVAARLELWYMGINQYGCVSLLYYSWRCVCVWSQLDDLVLAIKKNNVLMSWINFPKRFMFFL